MWTDGTKMIADWDSYIDPDGTAYPSNVPKEQIPGLTRVPDAPPYVPTPEEIAAQAAANALAFQQVVIAAVQARLDTFAKTRNYDGILSACTYATSMVAKFKTEGQYCVDIRDQTWSSLYSLMEAVQTGERIMPSAVTEILSLLPEPAWPN